MWERELDYGLLVIIAVIGATYAKFGTEVASNDGMRQMEWSFRSAAESVKVFGFVYSYS